MEYLRHWLTARKEQSIHSQFISLFYLRCVKASRFEFAHSDIERLRLSLIKDQTILSFIDPGNGQRLNKSIGSIAKTSAKSPRLCRLLAAMIYHFKPNTAIELGTSMGLSSLYQWKELSDDATFWTLEGNTAVIAYAQKHFNQFGAVNLKLVSGKFANALPKVLSEIDSLDWAFIDGHHQYQATLEYYELIESKLNENSVLVFDDINWSKGMQQAWKEIIALPEVTASVDLFFMGVVFFQKNLTKETFKLRL